MKKYTVDTNVLMRNKERLMELEGEILIPSFTLEELDRLKTKDGKAGYQAREAVRYIKENHENTNLTLDIEDDIDLSCLPKGWDTEKYDNRILAFAHNNDSAIVTHDFIVQLKAEAIGVEVVALDEDERADKYTGVKEVYVEEDDEILAKHYQDTKSNIFKLHVNEYLIIYDKNDSFIDDYDEVAYKKLDRIMRWDGEKLVGLKAPRDADIKPLNDLQECAIDLVFNDDIPIKIVTGGYGSGKTLISLRTGLHMTTKQGKFSKMMVVRNPDGDGDSKQIGFLKGDKEDKIADFFKPIAHNLPQKEFEMDALLDRGVLEFEVPVFMKGMSIEDTFMLIDEAEDLTLKTLKLIGTRVSRDSAICFSGDYKQVEDAYKNNNGLIQLINKTKDEPLVGCVTLREDVRSSVSKAFAQL